MQVKDIMHKDPVSCGPDATLHDVAKIMVDCHCGAVPVIDTAKRKPLGIVTDRDIVCRAVAEDKNSRSTRVKDVMSSPIVPVKPEDDVEACAEAMRKYQVRRLLVVDDDGEVAGIITQAQLAEALSPEKIGEMLKGVSQKTQSPSRVMAMSH